MTIEIPSCAEVADHLIAKPGKTFKLKDCKTRDESLFADKHAARAACEEDAHEIDRLQDILYAEQKQALLVVLQGIDTAGKSGTMRSVFAYTSPLGLQVAAFKKPTELELSHDYLWRVHQVVPRKGFIGIFDRSHYEDVLVVKVRGFAPKDDIEKRYEQINAFEKHLSENGVTMIKCMLNVGYEEQGRMFC